MAGGTQRRSCGSIVKSPSEVSDDGTVVDTPLSNTSIAGDDTAQLNDNLQRGKLPLNVTCGASADPTSGPAHDEIAPLGANIIEALQIVSKLEKLSLDKQAISLPKCVVLGMYILLRTLITH